LYKITTKNLATNNVRYKNLYFTDVAILLITKTMYFLKITQTGHRA